VHATGSQSAEFGDGAMGQSQGGQKKLAQVALKGERPRCAARRRIDLSDEVERPVVYMANAAGAS